LGILLRPLYCIDAMPQAAPVNFFPDGHSVSFGYVARRNVLGTDERDQAVDFQVCESPFAASDGCFSGEALAPVIAAQVVSDLVEVFAINILANDSAVADQFGGCFQDHCPKSDAVVGVTS